MEDGFPDKQIIKVDGHTITLSVYAFGLSAKGKNKTPKARMYRSGEFGLIYTLNNQTQGKHSSLFFIRKEVGMSRISNSLLVVIDCTALPADVRDDIFMASRDRIADNQLSQNILKEVAAYLKSSVKLKTLLQKRSQDFPSGDDVGSAAAAAIMQQLYREDKELLKFLFEGKQLPVVPPPPKPIPPFVGKQHPTFFKPAKLPPGGSEITKTAPVGKPVTIQFETDVVDNYFTRKWDSGRWDIYLVSESPVGEADSTTWGLLNLSRLPLNRGTGTLTIQVKNAQPGDTYTYELEITDSTLIKPFS